VQINRGIHADRTVGGYRNRRYSCGNAASGVVTSKGKGAIGSV